MYELRDIPEQDDETEDTAEISNGEEVVDKVVPSLVPKGIEDPLEIEDSPDPGGNEYSSQGTRPMTTTLPKPTKQQKSSVQPKLTLNTDGTENVESVKEVNDHFSRPDEAEGIGGSFVQEIVGHEYKIGHLHLKVIWSGGYTSLEHLQDMREDYPRMIAQYIVRNEVSWSKRGVDRVLQ